MSGGGWSAARHSCEGEVSASMISAELARALEVAGLAWHPARGDRFILTTAAFDSSEVFTVSDMVVEAHEFPTGTVLGFNGTTEWGAGLGAGQRRAVAAAGGSVARTARRGIP